MGEPRAHEWVGSRDHDWVNVGVSALEAVKWSPYFNVEPAKLFSLLSLCLLVRVATGLETEFDRLVVATIVPVGTQCLLKSPPKDTLSSASRESQGDRESAREGHTISVKRSFIQYTLKVTI